MRKNISRRDFVKSSGALVVCFSAASLIEPFAIEPFAMAQGPFDTHRSHIDPDKLDSWIAVASDGGVTAYTGKAIVANPGAPAADLDFDAFPGFTGGVFVG